MRHIEHTTNNMSDISPCQYPTEITEQNRKLILEQAKNYSSKCGCVRVFCVVSGAFAFTFIIMGIGIWASEIATNYNLQVPPYAQALLLLLSFVLYATVYTRWIAEKYESAIRHLRIGRFRLPTPREMVYFGCFSVSDKIQSGKRREAAKLVTMVIDDEISVFMNDVCDRSRRCYLPEMRLLAQGKPAFRRMFLFSQEKVGDLFLYFGSSLANDDDSMAFIYLKQLIKQAKKYGKLDGWYQRLTSKFTQGNAIIAALIYGLGLVLSALQFIYGSGS